MLWKMNEKFEQVYRSRTNDRWFGTFQKGNQIYWINWVRLIVDLENESLITISRCTLRERLIGEAPTLINNPTCCRGLYMIVIYLEYESKTSWPVTSFAENEWLIYLGYQRLFCYKLQMAFECKPDGLRSNEKQRKQTYKW